jgi:hypothetical protein
MDFKQVHRDENAMSGRNPNTGPVCRHGVKIRNGELLMAVLDPLRDLDACYIVGGSCSRAGCDSATAESEFSKRNMQE